MRYPEFLQKNGRIGFIAPSFGCVQEPYATLFKNTLDRFDKLGYELILGPNCYKEEGVGKSNTPRKCAEEINEFFGGDKSDVIISCGGGETMCEDLPYVDWQLIRESKPKWFMGYSDNTNLTFLLNTLCDTASIYGPCAASFGGVYSQYTDDAFKVLTGEMLKVSNYDEWYLEPSPSGIALEEGSSVVEVEGNDREIVVINDKPYIKMPYSQKVFMGDKIVDGVDFSGRLAGGCLDCISNLVGTKFDKVSEYADRYEEDGIIWFLEACDLNVMSIRRSLWQMEQAGWFKNVKGFLIGRPLHYYDTFGDFDRIEAVTGILSKYNVPIVMDIDLGHLSPQMPIISGSIGKVCAKNNTISIEYVLA